MNEIKFLFILALPVACVSWTISKEEVFREPREYLVEQSKDHDNPLLLRKLCYMPTCKYCLSHWVTLGLLLLTRYKLLYQGWRGYVIAFFSLVWVANVYMLLFGKLVA